MNWELLGNLGDFLGGLGVIVTLFYLAAQLRANTRQVRENARVMRSAAVIEMMRGSLQSIAFGQQPEVRRALMKSVAGLDALDFEEQFIVSSAVQALLRSFEADHAQFRAGLLDEDVWEGRKLAIKRRMGLRGAREMWERLRDEFSPAFRALMDEEVLSDPAPREHPAAKRAEPG